MTKTILQKLGAVGAAMWVLGGCASSFDVSLPAPDLALDTTNPVVPTLAAALAKNPKANTFSMVWKVVPDKTRPNEALARWIIYNRKAQILAFHRDAPQYERYSGVTDANLQAVAARRGNLQNLVAAGCTRTLVAENGGSTAR